MSKEYTEEELKEKKFEELNKELDKDLVKNKVGAFFIISYISDLAVLFAGAFFILLDTTNFVNMLAAPLIPVFLIVQRANKSLIVHSIKDEVDKENRLDNILWHIDNIIIAYIAFIVFVYCIGY